MATLLQVEGADFSGGATALEPPLRRALAGLFVLGGNAGLSARNFAPGAASPGTIVGSPVFQAGYMSAKGMSAYLDALLPQSDVFWWGILARMPLISDTNRPGLMGTQTNTPSAMGAGITASGFAGSKTAALTGLVSGVGQSTLNDTGGDVWGIYTFTNPGNSIAPSLKERTQNINGSVPGSVGATPVKNTNNPTIRIGSTAHPTFTGDTDVAAVIIHTDVLTAGEEALNLAWLRKVATKRLSATV